ncbi:MAG: hypothetical protein AB7I13_08305, partial [Vicinamibacterales bacterium]
MVTHEAPLDDDQLPQFEPDGVIVTVPEPPVEAKFCEVGETENEQGAGATSEMHTAEHPSLTL